MTATELVATQEYLRKYRADAENRLIDAKRAMEDAISSLEMIPNAPNLDHVFVPTHVLTAAEQVIVEEHEKNDFVVVAEGESF